MAIEVRNLIYIPEATIGTTPVDDAGWKTFRANVDNLTAEPQTVPSNELRGDRHPSGQFLTGLDVGGSLESELALTDPLDDLLEGLFMSAWTTDTISLGSTEKAFSIQRQYVAESRFLIMTGMRVASMNFKFDRGTGLGMVTTEFVGQSATESSTNAVGTGSVAAATSTRPLNVTSDLSLLQFDAGAHGILPSAIDITVSNNLTRKNVIGTLGAGDIGVHRASVTGSITSFVTQAGLDYWESKIKANVPVAVTFTLSDGTNNLDFEIPAAYLSGPPPGTPGVGTDSVQTFGFAAAYDATATHSIELDRS